MPAAAIADDGFFSIARLIASSNVTRSVGTGCAITTALVRSSTAVAVLTPFTSGPNGFHDDVQNRNEREIEKRGDEHAAGDGRTDRMARLLPRAAGEHERRDAEDEC